MNQTNKQCFSTESTKNVQETYLALSFVETWNLAPDSAELTMKIIHCM